MYRQNPWWKGKQYINEDIDFQKWRSSRINWIPELIKEINLEPFSLHFLYGARQVGKTTLLKILINDLLKTANPKAIFYFRCDQLADYKELDSVIKDYQKVKRMENIKTSYIFLDEITFPKEWYRAIKWHIDVGSFKEDVLLLTGSLSMFVESHVETFPGRRGKGKDFVMRPLSFREFVNLADPSARDIPEIKSTKLDVKNLSKFMPWLTRLNELFELYLQSGGFPLSVKSILDNKKIGEEVFNTYLNWIKGDLARLKRNESIAKRIIRAIIEKAPSPVSLHGLSKEFEIKSHKTVFDYIDIFEKLYLAKVLYYIDPNNGNKVYYKQRKIHFIDPFLYSLFSSWCMISDPDTSVIAESVVASHLARSFDIGYFKNKKEIDIVLCTKEEMLGIEVKWKQRAELRKAKIGKISKVITLTKSTFNSDPMAVPVSVFLYAKD